MYKLPGGVLMKASKALSAAILAAYCVPWAFLALYGDEAYGTLLLYGVLLCVSAALGWLCRGMELVLLSVVGNFLSCGMSWVCAHVFLGGEGGYFKPFGVTGWVLALSLVTLMIQLLIWNWRKDKGPALSLLVGVCAVSLGFLAAMILLLVYSAWSFGAL